MRSTEEGFSLVALARRCAIAAAGIAAIGGSGLLAAGAGAAGITSESPQQILDATASAVHSAKGYEMQAVLHEPAGTERLTLISAPNGNLEIREEQSPQRVASIVLIGPTAYIKASAGFWTAQGLTRTQAGQLSKNWYKSPAKDFTNATDGLGRFSPSTLAQCIREGEGPLSHAGTGTVNGQPAVLLKKAGGQPGTGPGVVAIAATGQPYPLRITETGPTLAGGKVDACNDGKASKATGVLTMSHWNAPPPVQAPANPITLPTSG